MIQKKGERSFLVRLDEKIKELGVIEVLRKGIKHFDKTIDLFYRKPSSSYNPKMLRVMLPICFRSHKNSNIA
jgi:type I restriction enzyme R subunit